MVSNHSIHQKTDLVKWLQNALDENVVKSRKNLVSVEQLKNVLKIIVFTLQMSKSSLEHVDKITNSEAPVGTVVHSKWSNILKRLEKLCQLLMTLYFTPLTKSQSF